MVNRLAVFTRFHTVGPGFACGWAILISVIALLTCVFTSVGAPGLGFGTAAVAAAAVLIAACAVCAAWFRWKQVSADLASAQRTADLAGQYKSEFLANISHELRTPMNAIIGMTQVALATPLSSEQREYLNTVSSAADSLLALLDEVLDFSRLEAGSLELNETEFEIRDSVSSALHSVAAKAQTKGLEMISRVAANVPQHVYGDERRLRQLLVNLVNNAIKFTEWGEILVEVAVEPGNPSQLRFSVRDTGIGVPPELQTAIFDPFRQVDGSSTRIHGGAGLGLAMCAKLVNLMQGRIWVESPWSHGDGQPARHGSSFHFTCGLRPGNTQDVLNSAWPGRRVLIVEHNPAARAAIAGAAAECGLLVSQTADAVGAIELLRSASRGPQPFDAVFIARHLGERSGFSLAERIRGDRQLRRTRIVIMAAADRRMESAWYDEFHIDGCLVKPVLRGDINRALDEAFSAPAVPEIEAPPAPVDSSGSASANNASPGPRARVLVVEDNAVNQLVVVRILQKDGYEVRTAADGREALALFEVEKPDVILMDLQMPNMDGLEATRRLRASEAGRDVPIIALTAHAMAGDREKCLQAGMNAYLSKPVQAEALRRLLAEVLKPETVRAA